MVYYQALKKEKFTQVNHPNQMPLAPAYGIYVFNKQTVYHEGDERSRTNPGHGYPSHSEEVNSSMLFVTNIKADWLEGIKNLYQGDEKRTDILAFRISDIAQVKMDIHVQMEIEV